MEETAANASIRDAFEWEDIQDKKSAAYGAAGHNDNSKPEPDDPENNPTKPGSNQNGDSYIIQNGKKIYIKDIKVGTTTSIFGVTSTTTLRQMSNKEAIETLEQIEDGLNSANDLGLNIGWYGAGVILGRIAKVGLEVPGAFMALTSHKITELAGRIEAVKEILQHSGQDITFISNTTKAPSFRGTPISTPVIMWQLYNHNGTMIDTIPIY